MSADLPEGFTAAPPGGNGGGGAEEAQKRAQEEDMRQQMIHSILDVDAQARLARIALVKPDKARLLQNKLLCVYALPPRTSHVAHRPSNALLHFVCAVFL